MRRGAAGAIFAISLLAASALALDAGEPAPELGLPDLSGRQLTIASLRGRVVLVDFWASWCAPCTEEMPVLERLHRQYHAQGLTIVAVSIDRELADVRRFLVQSPVSFAIVHDGAQRVAGRYRPPLMPSSYFIDRNGVVRHAHAGFRATDAVSIEQRVRALLAER